MKKVFTALALCATITAHADNTVIREMQGTVTGRVVHNVEKQCTQPTTGKQIGSTAIGAASGYVVGRLLFGKSGGMIGGLFGAGTGAAVSSTPSCKEITTYNVSVKSSDGKTFLSQTKVNYQIGNPVTILILRDGGITIF